MIVSVISIPLV